ncbi:hypothetical protein BC835DRAFT_401105 [Cytidiella melzeri]|nr:hypothetical protein BC835DRAFT_401105 [Cytidiella melzeri]
MDKDVLSIVVIVLELIGAVLLCALLATPAPKHAIVKAFVVTTLAHSIATVIPSIAFQVIPDNLDALQDHPMIQAFCAADAIIFTLPLLYLSCKFRRYAVSSTDRYTHGRSTGICDNHPQTYIAEADAATTNLLGSQRQRTCLIGPTWLVTSTSSSRKPVHQPYGDHRATNTCYNAFSHGFWRAKLLQRTVHVLRDAPRRAAE